MLGKGKGGKSKDYDYGYGDDGSYYEGKDDSGNFFYPGGSMETSTENDYENVGAPQETDVSLGNETMVPPDVGSTSAPGDVMDEAAADETATEDEIGFHGAENENGDEGDFAGKDPINDSVIENIAASPDSTLTPTEVEEDDTEDPTEAPTSFSTEVTTDEATTDAPTSFPTEDPTIAPTWFPTEAPTDVEILDDDDMLLNDTFAEEDGLTEAPTDAAPTTATPNNSTSDNGMQNSWTYAVEFQPNLMPTQKDRALNVLELQLVSEVMTCETAAIGKLRRRLQDNEMTKGVAGLDYMPRDTIREDEQCFSDETIGECNTVNGAMELYLEQNANGAAARRDILARVQAALSQSDFTSVPEIIGAYYIGPDLSEINAATEDDTSSQLNANEGDGMPAGAVAGFAAIGLVAFMGVALAFRKKRRHDIDAGTMTLEPDLAAGSRTAGDPMGKSPSKVTPFSAMLPQAYNLNDPETMSAILEGDSDSQSGASQGSVIVSEGGFTTDGEDSMQDDSVYTSKLGTTLGEQEHYEDHADADLLFDNDEKSVSTIDKTLSKEIM
ncbi:MAG: hypothetical protein SGARI_000345 [Bacillariaceae sp.]